MTEPTAFRIRAARRGDVDALSALLRELGYATGLDVNTMNWVVSHPECEVIVAADSHDRPVGMVSLSHRPQLRLKGRLATIDELVVAEAWRRKGVGRQLLNRAVERAKVLGVKRLEVVSHQGREAVARDFYKACGFEEADASVFRHREVDFQRVR